MIRNVYINSKHYKTFLIPHHNSFLISKLRLKRLISEIYGQSKSLFFITKFIDRKILQNLTDFNPG